MCYLETSSNFPLNKPFPGTFLSSLNWVNGALWCSTTSITGRHNWDKEFYFQTVFNPPQWDKHVQDKLKPAGGLLFTFFQKYISIQPRKTKQVRQVWWGMLFSILVRGHLLQHILTVIKMLHRSINVRTPPRFQLSYNNK